MEGCIKRKDKVTSTKLSECSLLIDDCAAGYVSSASCGVLVDGFESIQVGCVLLSHEVNGRKTSLIQGAQKLVIVEARVAFGRLGTDDAISALKKKDRRRLF